MNQSISPDLTQIAFDEQGTDFFEGAFAGRDRRQVSEFGSNHNTEDFGTADHLFIGFIKNEFRDGGSASPDIDNGLENQPDQREISNRVAHALDCGINIGDGSDTNCSREVCDLTFNKSNDDTMGQGAI